MSQTATLSADVVVDRVCELLCLRKRKSEIRIILTDELQQTEPISPRVLETVIRLARQRLQEGAAVSREEQFERAVGFWELVIASSETTWAEKSRAQERLENLLGIGAQFGPIVTEQIEEHLTTVREAIARQHSVSDSDNGDGANT